MLCGETGEAPAPLAPVVPASNSIELHVASTVFQADIGPPSRPNLVGQRGFELNAVGRLRPESRAPITTLLEGRGGCGGSP